MNDFVVKNSIQLGGSFKGNASDVTLSVNGYDLGVAAYDGVSFSVTSFPRGLFFKPNGTEVFITDINARNVNKYSLSTAWDISTASFVQNFSVSAQDTQPIDLFFKPDGTKMYFVGLSGVDINEYNLSTAWDISTASFVQNFSVSAQETQPHGLSFKPDGTKMYVVGMTGKDINEYNLSTAWDVSTASYLQNFSVSAQTSLPTGLFFVDDGTKVFVTDYFGSVKKYTLSTTWDITSASYVQNFSVSAQETQLYGVGFKSDGTKMYITGNVSDAIFQYTTGTFTSLDLSTADAFEVTPTADVTLGFRYAPAAGNAKSFSVALTGADVGSSYDIANASYTTSSSSLQSVAPTPRGLAFKPDGTKMYVSSVDNEAVYQYSLSTAWDASTASYDSVSFSVSSQTAYPVEISFKLDGTEMYIASLFPASVFQYTLSTAWDISSASFTGSLSAAVNMDAILKSDGTKMFTLSGTTITSYTLSTAWDITSASSDAVTLSVSSQDGDTRALFVTPDGLKLFVVGSSTDTVYRYSLPSAWNLSGASYDNVSFSVASEDTLPFGLEFKTDGKVMYILGATGGVVDQYTSGTFSNATITYPSSVVWSGGTAPTTPADGVTDLLTFYTEDGGNTYYGFKVGEAMA